MFFPCKNHDTLNGKSFDPEVVSGRVMVNPHYQNITLWDETKEVMIDSGAFQERDMLNRVSPLEAISRQTGLMSRLMYQRRTVVPQFKLVIYDKLVGVDEAIIDGKRVKKRGTDETAQSAVEETLQSGKCYAQNRHLLNSASIVFSSQGVSTEQYYGCAKQLISLMREGDIFAFGGFCILGRKSSLLPQFKETVRAVLPLLKQHGVRRAHLLGVGVHTGLEFAYAEAARYGVAMSTDGSYVELNSVHGKVWDLRNKELTKTRTPWRRVYTKEQKKREIGGYHPCDLAMANIERFAEWTNLGCPPAYSDTLTRVDDFVLYPGLV